MNRHMKAVTLTHTTGKEQNAYGKFEPTTTTSTIDMAISTTVGGKQEHSNILTIDSTHIGLTKDTSITTEDTITDGSDTYNVDYVISGRYTQCFLKLVK